MRIEVDCAGLSAATMRELDEVRPTALEKIGVRHLKMDPHCGSAAFYVTKCREANADAHSPFCAVRLTGVSLNDDRSANDFDRAYDALVGLYSAIIGMGSVKPVELSVVIMLDQPLKGSTMVEKDSTVVR